jgi:hypothetical protein
MVWYGMAWYGEVWHGMVRYGMVRYGMAWYGMIWYGMVWYGMYGRVFYGMVWYGMVWHGMVWLAGAVGQRGHGVDTRWVNTTLQEVLKRFNTYPGKVLTHGYSLETMDIHFKPWISILNHGYPF